MNDKIMLLMACCATSDSPIIIEVNRDGHTYDLVHYGTKPVSISGRVRASRPRVKSKRCLKCNVIVDQAASCCWKCGSKRIG